MKFHSDWRGAAHEALRASDISTERVDLHRIGDVPTTAQKETYKFPTMSIGETGKRRIIGKQRDGGIETWNRIIAYHNIETLDVQSARWNQGLGSRVFNHNISAPPMAIYSIKSSLRFVVLTAAEMHCSRANSQSDTRLLASDAFDSRKSCRIRLQSVQPRARTDPFFR